MACGSTKTIEGLLAGTFVFGLIFGAPASAQDRMPPIPADKLTPAQKKTVDEYKKARGGEPGGPWAVLTRSPELMSRTLMLSDYLRFNSTLSRDWAQQQSFSVPIARPTDNGVRPALALTHLWRNSGGFTWQPIGLINLASDVTSTRDLRVYPDSTSLGRLAYSEREFLFSRIAGALSCSGMNIVAAEAFANASEVVLDTFRFSDDERRFDDDAQRSPVSYQLATTH